MLTLSPQTARRLAITRQRLAGPRPSADADGIMQIFRDIRCVQIDPIRAVERTQLLVLWSRLGSYDPAQLDHLLWKERKLFEYWAHAASIVLTEDYPLHQMQMRHFAQDNRTWSKRVRRWLDDNESFRQHVLARLRDDGPLEPSQIEDLSIVPWQSTGWTNARNTTQMISFLWEQGDVMVAARDGLKKKWALTAHHLPPWTPKATLANDEVVYQALQYSLRGLGVGTAKQMNNHFIRNSYPNLEAILGQLLAEARIIPVTIQEKDETWSGEWYVHADDVSLLEGLATGQAWQPRTSLLSPFDNLICDRDRTEQLWNFYFRIEIYVPKAKRQYGYYVLPILHGDQLIGRIDPTMDRKTGTLHIKAIYLEPEIDKDPTTAQAVVDAISDLGHFLGAKRIDYHAQIPSGWQQILT